MTRDANQIAQEASRREGTSGFRDSLQPPQRLPGVQQPKPRRGTLTIWQDIARMSNAEPWLIQSEDVIVDLSKTGLLITHDPDGNTEVFCTTPGWYINFVPNHEGE